MSPFVLVLVKVARHKKGGDNAEEMKRFVAWTLEQHHQLQQSDGAQRINVIYDFTGAGIMNMVHGSS